MLDYLKTKFKNPGIFWGHSQTYCLNLMISLIFPWKPSGDFGTFFSQKSFACVTLDFVLSPSAKN
jgi:hypothetical protein